MSANSNAGWSPDQAGAGEARYHATATQERRKGPRRHGGFWANLVTLEGEEVVRCDCDDLGEGGLHFTAPVGFGFAVGQRYEILVGERDEAGREKPLTGEGHYATVVRTRFLLDQGEDSVGVGLRFDQPVVF